jgi:predicted dinucleotide-binding enzyme
MRAVAFGEAVALTVPWGTVEGALEAAGPFDGKILWDCTNALKADMSGLEIGATTSGAEIIARLAKGARAVKGIPPFAELLHSADPTVGGRPAGSFLCGDDPGAKAVVRRLLEALPATVVDAGPLESARYVEPAAFLLVRLAYGQGLGGRIGLSLLQS